MIGIAAMLVLSVVGMKMILSASPIYWIVMYLTVDSSYHHGIIVAVWSALIVGFVWLIKQLTLSMQHQIVSRKLFHLLAVILFAPTLIFYDEFVSLAFGVGLCGLVFTEFVRIAQDAFPYLSITINSYFALFIDRRDNNRGMVLSHIYLLLGIAIPVWAYGYLSLHCSAWEGMNGLKYLKHIGWISVGVGDSFAAYIGTLYGKTKWRLYNGKRLSRSIEGSVACYSSMVLTSAAILYVEGILSTVSFVNVAVVLAAVTILEAYCSDIDNLVLPIFGCGCYLYVLGRS